MKAAAPAGASDPVHRVHLLGGDDKVIAAATWHVTSASDGVIQILEFNVDSAHRRQRQGGRLMEMLVREAREHFRGRRANLRRIWIGLEHEKQVIGRAFLTGHGFHHVGTVKNLLCDQDLMVYSKAFD